MVHTPRARSASEGTYHPPSLALRAREFACTRIRKLDHGQPEMRSTTRMADSTVAIVPCPGKTESPTTHSPGPRTSEPTARKLLLDRETGGPPTAPPARRV